MAVAVLDALAYVATEGTQKDTVVRGRLQHLLLKADSSVPLASLLPIASKVVLLQS